MLVFFGVSNLEGQAGMARDLSVRTLSVNPKLRTLCILISEVSSASVLGTTIRHEYTRIKINTKMVKGITLPIGQ
jgi:hypothetical protein